MVVFDFNGLGIVCFPNLETLLASDNQITDIFELTYLSKLKHLEINNNKISDPESLDFLNMLESIEYIDISANPLIDCLEDEKTLNVYFYIQKEEFNSPDDDKIDPKNKENLGRYSLEEIKNNKALRDSIRVKAHNCKIIICKI